MIERWLLEGAACRGHSSMSMGRPVDYPPPVAAIIFMNSALALVASMTVRAHQPRLAPSSKMVSLALRPTT